MEQINFLNFSAKSAIDHAIRLGTVKEIAPTQWVERAERALRVFLDSNWKMKLIFHLEYQIESGNIPNPKRKTQTSYATS
jgi:hypothetical protein